MPLPEPTTGQPTRTMGIKLRRPQAADRERLQSGTAADECQVPVIPNIDDGFRAPRSVARLSSSDPELSDAHSESTAESGHTSRLRGDRRCGWSLGRQVLQFGFDKDALAASPAQELCAPVAAAWTRMRSVRSGRAIFRLAYLRTFHFPLLLLRPC